MTTSEENTGTIDKIYRYLTLDPVGTKPINTGDQNIWKKNSNFDSDDEGEDQSQQERFVPTRFGENLFVYQKRMYKFMRASLPLYLDKTAADRLKLWIIAQEVNLTDEQRARRLDKGVRIPWADMQEYVLSTICAITLGSYR